MFSRGQLKQLTSRMAQLARPHRLNVKCLGRAAHRGRVRCGRGGAAIVVAVVLGLFDEFHCVQIDLALLEDFVEHHRHQAHRDALAGALARGRVPAAVGPVEEDVILVVAGGPGSGGKVGGTVVPGGRGWD